MDLGSINWLAVIASVVASMIIGSIWFHPSVFYKPWLATMGKSWGERAQGSMVAMYAFTIIAAFVEAVALAFVLNALGFNTAVSGLMGGFMLWLGFVAPTNLVNKLFSGQGWMGWVIEAGEHLVYLLVAGAIIGAWH